MSIKVQQAVGISTMVIGVVGAFLGWFYDSQSVLLAGDFLGLLGGLVDPS